MVVSALTSKSRITIPARVRRALGLEPEDRLEFVEQGKDEFPIGAATCSVEELKGLFQGKRSKPYRLKR